MNPPNVSSLPHKTADMSWNPATDSIVIILATRKSSSERFKCLEASSRDEAQVRLSFALEM